MVVGLSEYASGMSLGWALASAAVGLAIMGYVVVKLVMEARRERQDATTMDNSGDDGVDAGGDTGGGG